LQRKIISKYHLGRTTAETCASGDVGATPASGPVRFPSVFLHNGRPANAIFLVIRDARGDSAVNARFALGKSKSGDKNQDSHFQNLNFDTQKSIRKK
jgi:hypothetical protein